MFPSLLPSAEETGAKQDRGGKVKIRLFPLRRHTSKKDGTKSAAMQHDQQGFDPGLGTEGYLGIGGWIFKSFYDGT